MSDTYYDQDGITIYHADNADVEWPDPDDVGLLLTDPPYGVGFNGVAHEGWVTGSGSRPKASSTAGVRIAEDDQPFIPTRCVDYAAVLFGANNYTDRLPVGGWVVWDKTGGGKAHSFMADAELIWHNRSTSVSVFHHLWLGAHRDSEAGPKGLRGVHPTQKPVALMRWIVDKWTDPGDLVFDPYMGSGPVARACLDLGRRYIGIEIVEEYCQAAVDRLGQLALALEDV